MEDAGCAEFVRRSTFWVTDGGGASEVYDAPIHSAIKNPDMIKLFLDHGASPNAVKVEGHQTNFSFIEKEKQMY